MVTDVPIDETRHGRILARLTALAMARVEDLQVRALAAEPTEEAVGLHAACGKAERSVRQTLALELKFVCDHARAAREDERQARDFAQHRQTVRKEAVIRRKEALRLDLERVAWDEFDHDPASYRDFVEEELYAALAEEARLATFLEEPLPAQFDRIQRELGLGQDPAAEEAAPPAQREDASDREPDAADPDVPEAEDLGPSGDPELDSS